MMAGNLEVIGNIKFNKANSFKLRAVFTKENEDQEDLSFLNDTINLYNNIVETNDRSESERIIRLSFNKQRLAKVVILSMDLKVHTTN